MSSILRHPASTGPSSIIQQSTIEHPPPINASIHQSINPNDPTPPSFQHSIPHSLPAEALAKAGAFSIPHSPDALSALRDLISRLDPVLPDRQPTLLTLFHLYCLHGLTVLQVARHCRCSASTVYSRLARLRSRFEFDPKPL